MKIVVVSDNHGNYSVLKEILDAHQDADYYFHLGDSEMEIDEIKPFCGVRGNVDFDYNFPFDKVIDVGEHSFYLTHGNAYSSDVNLLSKAAKNLSCDFVLFGHTHSFYNQTIDGIRVINPGSCSRPKDGTKPSYAIITINDNQIDVKRVDIELKC